MIYPSSYVIRSRQGIYVELLIMFTLTSAIVALSVAGTHNALGDLPKLMYLPLPLAATVKTLKYLAQLEKAVSEPDANMYFVFHLAAMLPVLGYMPVVLFV